MRIFLSWSGDRSKYLAKCFKEWLPNVLQYVDPYMSEKDIKLGERWGKSIEENLRSNDFGLVFITPENIDAPWINFEAGALSKSLQSRLVPILYDTQVTILNNGPLKQFQSSKEVSKESIKQLVLDINEFAEETEHLKEERLESAFDKWWSDLDEQLKEIPEISQNSEQEVPSDEKILNVILHEIQSLKDFNRNSNNSRVIFVHPDLFDDLERIEFDLKRINELACLQTDEFDVDIIKENIIRIEKIKRYLRRFNRRLKVDEI